MPRGQPTAKTTNAKADQHNTLFPLLEAMYKEFQELSKKKPDGQVGASKVKMVNRLLESIFQTLDGEPNRRFLDLLDSDELPQNSDVVLMLGQTLAAMNAYRSKYVYWNGHDHVWSV